MNGSQWYSAESKEQAVEYFLCELKTYMHKCQHNFCKCPQKEKKRYIKYVRMLPYGEGNEIRGRGEKAMK